MIIHFSGTSQQGKGVFSPDPVPDVYVVSVAPSEYTFPASGNVSDSTIVAQVTCSLNGGDTTFTAEVTSNLDGVIASLGTTSGNNGTDIYVTANAWTEAACRGQALITITCGDQTALLTIYQNGTNPELNCGS